MSYWQFRLRIYHHFFANWLITLKQISWGLSALLPLAFPIVIFTPLLALGILAKTNTPTETYSMTLWGYLLLTYSWTLFQKEGILASHYKSYDASLPINPAKRQAATIGLVLYCSGLFLLAPLLFLFVLLGSYIANSPYDIIITKMMQLYPLIGLIGLSLYYAFRALTPFTPWLSLFLSPLILMYFGQQLSQLSLLLIWCAAIIIERRWTLQSINLKLPFNGLFKFYLKADCNRASNSLNRLICVILVLIIGKVFFEEVKVDVKDNVAYFFTFILSVLVASKLIEIRQVQQQYALYLSTLPLSNNKQQLMALSYCLSFSVLFIITIMLFNFVALKHWVFFFIIYAATQLGILITKKHYLLFPLFTSFIVWLCVSAFIL